ncbi:HesA/MoeB/ThiF family protein [Desulfonatronospira sp.]|uniref:HesA/MoeB/ThiF family protein n=1 Tax=Desulfonatronospira sp. TaxID=1962951 RepID=UPI0025BC1731|nr:HesA/MoeB/ThiF family protein [Desulfonatronospira sp.]
MELSGFIQDLARHSHTLDNYPFACILDAPLLDLAGNYNIQPWQAQVKALENQICPERYIRNFKTISLDMQLDLARSRVIVVGAGGLGGFVIELLVRSGVGRMTVADGDVFELSNLNRQLLGSTHLVGKNKVEAAGNRAKDINPFTRVKTCGKYLQQEDLPGLLPESDLVLDCLGGVEFREQLLQAAGIHGCPVVTGFVAGNTGLASTVFPGDRTPAAFWQAGQGQGAEIALGNVACTVSMIATLQAREAIHILTRQKPCLRNRVFLADMQACSFESLEI